MSNGQERRERAAKLHMALQEYLDAIGETEMLGDWLAIAATVSVDRDGDPTARYHMFFSNGSMLDHHALGLVAKAEEMLMDGSTREDAVDDD
jgi:hypothetical protein